MTSKDLQTRINDLSIFFFWWISFIFSIFLTNIIHLNALYLIIYFESVLFIYHIYWKVKLSLIIATIIWLILWFSISYKNFESIKSNTEIIEKSTKNYTIESTIKWIILETTETSIKNNKYIFKLEKNNDISLKNPIYLDLKTSPAVKLSYWDIISFKSKIREFKDFEDFEYKNFKLTKWLYWEVTIWKYSINWSIWWLYKSFIVPFRIKIINIIENIFPWNSAKLVKWIFLWVRSDYPEELNNNFVRSWLSHIVAVSWYNITIIIIFFAAIFKNIPDKLRTIIIIGMVLIFLILIWDNSPAIRAGIMWLIAFIWQSNWKKVNIYSVILISSIIMIIYNPFILNYDIWFQLSFLAIIWLITIWDYLNDRFGFITDRFTIRSNLVATISVTILWFPIMAANFWQLSIISFISNIFVLPLIPYSMLFSWLSVFIYNFSSNLWIYIWFIAYIILDTILQMINFFWNLQYAVINFDIKDYIYYFNSVYFVIITIIILSILDKKLLINNFKSDRI